VRVCLTKNLSPRRCGDDVIRDCSLTDAVMEPVRSVFHPARQCGCFLDSPGFARCHCVIACKGPLPGHGYRMWPVTNLAKPPDQPDRLHS